MPQNRPLGLRLNDDGTIDLGGPRVASTQRYRTVQANPRVVFVVDDPAPDEPGALEPGMGRGVEIRGIAETLTVQDLPDQLGWQSNEIIRLHLTRGLGGHIDPGEAGRAFARCELTPPHPVEPLPRPREPGKSCRQNTPAGKLRREMLRNASGWTRVR